MASNRTRQKQSEHDALVRRIAEDHVAQGWETYADLIGWTNPPEIKGHIPDVYAKGNVGERLIEVETPESAHTAHAKAQAIAFRAWQRSGLNRTFETRVTEG